MRDYCLNRQAESHDQVWFVEHPPVFTQGISDRPEHLLHTSNIPVVKTDRGGKITYHGPGQLVMYVLFDLNRLQISVKDLVELLENLAISSLKFFGIKANTQDGAPGVYINEDKIASLGLRVKKGMSYHGLSINIDMDLTPFQQINPCGYKGLRMTQLNDLNVCCTPMDFAGILLHELVEQIPYDVNVTR